MNTKQVIDLFVDRGIIDRGQVDDLMAEVSNSGSSITQVLVDFGFLTEEQFYENIADSLGTEVVDLRNFEPPPEILRLIPAGLAQLHKALPIGMNGDAITICLADPLDSQIPEDLRFALGRDVYVVVAPVYQIEDTIRKHFGTDAASMDEILAQLGNAG